MAFIKRYQEGGAMPAEDPNAQMAPAAGQDQAMQQIYQMAQEIIQQLGPEAAMMLAQAIAEMVQGASEMAGQAPEGEQQFMRCGGKVKKTKKRAKAACGKKMTKGGKC